MQKTISSDYIATLQLSRYPQNEIVWAKEITAKTDMTFNYL